MIQVHINVARLSDALLPDEEVFASVLIPVTDPRPGIVVGLYVSAVGLKMTHIRQLTAGIALEKCEIAVSFTGDEVEIAILVPVANCDCCALASAIAQRNV